MPSFLHHALLVPFRHRPALAAELLRGVFHLPLPAPGTARVGDGAVSRVSPTEHRPDLVVLLGRGAPRYGLVLEVQLRRSPHKPFVWPLYHAALRARLRAPVTLLVLAPRAPVAAWARAAISTGQPGGDFSPCVVGPHNLPRLTALGRARAAPQLALLGALVHGPTDGGRQVVITALTAFATARRLDSPRASLYHDLVLDALPTEERRAVEATMASAPHPRYVSEFTRRLTQSHLEGLIQGKAEGKAEGLLAILRLRGLALTAAEQARILATTDLPTLDRWIARAMTATAAVAVLEPRARARRSSAARTRRRRATGG